jgi:hypothetical protein
MSGATHQSNAWSTWCAHQAFVDDHAFGCAWKKDAFNSLHSSSTLQAHISQSRQSIFWGSRVMMDKTEFMPQKQE